MKEGVDIPANTSVVDIRPVNPLQFGQCVQLCDTVLRTFPNNVIIIDLVMGSRDIFAAL